MRKFFSVFFLISLFLALAAAVTLTLRPFGAFETRRKAAEPNFVGPNGSTLVFSGPAKVKLGEKFSVDLYLDTTNDPGFTISGVDAIVSVNPPYIPVTKISPVQLPSDYPRPSMEDKRLTPTAAPLPTELIRPTIVNRLYPSPIPAEERDRGPIDIRQDRDVFGIQAEKDVRTMPYFIQPITLTGVIPGKIFDNYPVFPGSPNLPTGIAIENPNYTESMKPGNAPGEGSGRGSAVAVVGNAVPGVTSTIIPFIPYAVHNISGLKNFSVNPDGTFRGFSGRGVFATLYFVANQPGKAELQIVYKGPNITDDSNINGYAVKIPVSGQKTQERLLAQPQTFTIEVIDATPTPTPVNPTPNSKLPDLVISGGIQVAGNYGIVNSEIPVKFTLLNQGTALAYPATYSYTNQSDGFSRLGPDNTCTATISLAPGQSCLSYYFIRFPTAGNKTLTVNLDPNNLVKESNETNNSYTTSFIVQNGPGPISNPSPIILPLTPPLGCIYQKVQCFKEPCDSILVCAPSPTPTAVPTLKPTATPIPPTPTPLSAIINFQLTLESNKSHAAEVDIYGMKAPNIAQPMEVSLSNTIKLGTAVTDDKGYGKLRLDLSYIGRKFYLFAETKSHLRKAANNNQPLMIQPGNNPTCNVLSPPLGGPAIITPAPAILPCPSDGQYVYFGTLTAGNLYVDASGQKDNIINNFDVGDLFSAWNLVGKQNLTPEENKKIQIADLNGDGTVNNFDYVIIVRNYNKTGDINPIPAPVITPPLVK